MIPKNAGDDNEVRVHCHGSKGIKKREGRIKLEKVEEDAQPTQPNKPDQE